MAIDVADAPKPPRQRLSEALVTDLLDMIQGGVVRPGMKLPTESELSDRFGVSRTVVREAIGRLRAGGFVRSAQGRGTFVLTTPTAEKIAVGFADPADLSGVLSLLEFRIAVEVESAALAARRHTPQQLARIDAALARFESATEIPAAAVEADLNFHLSIAHASGNSHFPAMLESLGPGALVVPHARLHRDQMSFRRAYDEHAAIRAAIASRDALAASAAMRAHLVSSGERLRAG